jgi:ketosteroid isomerase-like protein
MASTVGQAQAIAARAEAFYHALAINDADAVAEGYAPGAWVVHPSSRYETGEESVAGVRHGVHKQGPVSHTGRDIHLTGNGSAVSTELIDFQDRSHGEPYFMLRWREILVWVLIDGSWKILARQLTKVPL